MKIVIDISEDDYRKAKDGRASVSIMQKAIRYGTPLSEGAKMGEVVDESVDEKIKSVDERRDKEEAIKEKIEAEERGF